MKAATDENPLYEFYLEIYNELEWLKNNINIEAFPVGKPINEDSEALLKLILENNGCAFNDYPVMHEHTLSNVKDYSLLFIYGGKANEKNDCFDYIEFYNYRYLIVFMDYFYEFFNNIESSAGEDDVEGNLNELMGRSVYFDALKKVSDIFISTITPYAEISNTLATTAAANNYRFAGIFIAAKLINDFVGLGQEDQYLIKYTDLMNMLENIPMTLLLNGVKFLE